MQICVQKNGGDTYFEMYRATTPTEEKIQLLCRQAFQHSEKNHNCWYPFDENRVLLPHSNYVSACYVHSGHFNYMACQAPIASTIDAFWEMVISHRSQLILTLANPSEFPNYWPQVGETIRNGEDEIIGLNIEALSRFEDKDVIVKRVFKVKHQGEEWIVNQLHFMNWPDRGIIQLDYLQRFIELADSLDEAYPSHFTVIHCLGGIGRTGVIMAAREIYRAFKIHAQDNDPKDFTYPIKELVYRLRRQRLAMVHTLEQYLLLHQHLDSLRYSLINK